MHNSTDCPICSGMSTNGGMTDIEFGNFLTQCRREYDVKQQRLGAVVGNDSTAYDLFKNNLRIGARNFSTTAIGSFSPEYKTWLWGWANRNFPEVAKVKSSNIKKLFGITGFNIFMDEGARATAVDAISFSAMAVHILEADGCMCFEEGSMLFLAVYLGKNVV